MKQERHERSRENVHDLGANAGSVPAVHGDMTAPGDQEGKAGRRTGSHMEYPYHWGSEFEVTATPGLNQEYFHEKQAENELDLLGST